MLRIICMFLPLFSLPMTFQSCQSGMLFTFYKPPRSAAASLNANAKGVPNASENFDEDLMEKIVWDPWASSKFTASSRWRKKITELCQKLTEEKTEKTSAVRWWNPRVFSGFRLKLVSFRKTVSKMFTCWPGIFRLSKTSGMEVWGKWLSASVVEACCRKTFLQILSYAFTDGRSFTVKMCKY